MLFNKPRDDELYNIFISNRIKTENFSNGIYFKIERVQSKEKTFDAEKTLKQGGTFMDFQNLTQIHNQQNLLEETQSEDMKALLITLGLESQPNPDFFQDDNVVRKNRQQNTATQKLKQENYFIQKMQTT